MEQIQIKNNKIFIKSKDICLSEVYTFVHDLGEPRCNHFSGLPIHILYYSDDTIVFEQKFFYLGDSVDMRHEIFVTDYELEWKMQKLNPYNSVPSRFGISLPITGALFSNDSVIENLVNYEMHWRYNYPGQTNLNLPIIKTKIGCPCYVACQMDNNVQLFRYRDNYQDRLKISSMYEEDAELRVKISTFQCLNDNEGYVSLFPEAENYVYSWKSLFNKIKQKYGITVTHQLVSSPYSSRLLNQTELTNFAHILEDELSFYPSSFWNMTLINKITVSGDIKIKNKIIHGHCCNDGILINGTEAAINIRKAIHHEIFHLIDPIPEYPIPRDSFYDYYQPTSIGNYRAELFANYIVDPKFINNLINTDFSVKEQWRNIISNLTDDIVAALKNHKKTKENIGLTMVPSEQTTEIQIKSVYFTAIKHTDKKILENILDTKIDWKDLINAPSHVICLTINPLDYCAMEYVHFGILPDKSMDDWIRFHRQAILKSAHFLQIEKIYQCQWAFLKRFFSNTNFQIKKKIRFHEIPRSIPLKGIPILQKVWNMSRSHPIIEKVGYHHVSLEE